jgi:hypothetical protein
MGSKHSKAGGKNKSQKRKPRAEQVEALQQKNVYNRSGRVIKNNFAV